MNPEPQSPLPQTGIPHSAHSTRLSPLRRRRAGKISGLPKASRNKPNQIALSRLTRQGIKRELRREDDAQREATDERWQATLKDAGILP